jgi:TP901 family phage tail tape measure protein
MADQFSASILLKLIDNLSTPLLKVGSAFDELDKKFSSTSRLTMDLGKKMTTFATLPIMGWAAYAAHEASKTEIAFREMGHSLEALPEDSLKGLRKDLLDMSIQVPRSADELASYAEMAGRMNELGNVKGFTQFMTAFTSVNKDMRSKEGISNFMDMVRTLKITQSEYEHTGDVITVLSQRLNTSATAIVDNAKELSHLKMTTKITNEELMAFGAWADAFGATGGLAMKQFTKQMSEAALGKNMFGAELITKVTGIKDVAAFQKEFEKGPAVVMQKFLKGLSRMKEEGHVYELSKVLDALGLSGNRVMSMILKGAITVDEFTRALNLANDKTNINGKMMKDAAEIYKDFNSQMTMLLGAVNKFAEQFGRDVKPVWIWFIDMTKTLLAIFTELPAPVRYTIEALLGVVAIVGPALLVFGAIKGALGVLGITAGATALSIGVLAPPILAVAAAIIAVINAVRVWEKYKNSLMPAGESGWDTAKEFGKWFANDFSKLSNRALGTNFDWFNPERSGAGGAMSRGEALINIKLDSGLQIGGVQKKGNIVPEVNSEGYMGLRFAH